MPDWKTILSENFDYDLWANRAWLPLIVADGNDEERGILFHILGASVLWEARIGGVSMTAPPDIHFEDAFLLDLHNRWLQCVQGTDYDRVIAYRNLKGQPFEAKFGDIARHVVNHGTYHRGHLRHMREARGVEFPETDFIGYAFVRDGVQF